MAFVDQFLPEFDREMSTTRSLLERVPLDKASWKPHAKSRSLGQIAAHLAGLAHFGALISTMTEFNVASGEDAPPANTTQQLLGQFDENVASSRRALASLKEDELGTPWTLKAGDHVVFTLPRVVVLRTLLMSHSIHHRGQLSVYLRLLDVPLPAIYGPTADT